MNLSALQWQHKAQLFYPWLTLMILGWLMVSSASTGIAEHYTGNASYFTIRHFFYVIFGIAMTFAVSTIPMKRWMKIDALFLLVGFVGLILVFVPGIGHTVNGSQRWLNLGLIKIQASEIAKLGAIFYIAGYLVRRQKEVTSQWSGFIKPLIILMVMVALLLAEPDFGAVIVLMGAAMIQLFLGGVKAGQFFLLTISAIGTLALVASTAEYRMKRLVGFLDPWAPDQV
ncbi:MAG: FtsW/RodA/SpoVE family cell cycle protein, partial [Oleibacter sp.]|nr:FtsW/RodA/SpoVE family cell cycle protein [Thalassolituus sp.]